VRQFEGGACSGRFLAGEVTVPMGLLGLDGPLLNWASLFFRIIQTFCNLYS
jgi:hypothetical protein